MEPTYSSAEAAAGLGIGEAALRGWVRQGRLTPIVDDHGKRRYPRSEITRAAQRCAGEELHPDRRMRPKDAQNLAGVDQARLDDWVAAGWLVLFVMDSGHRRYDRLEVLAAMQRQAEADRQGWPRWVSAEWAATYLHRPVTELLTLAAEGAIVRSMEGMLSAADVRELEPGF